MQLQQCLQRCWNLCSWKLLGFNWKEPEVPDLALKLALLCAEGWNSDLQRSLPTYIFPWFSGKSSNTEATLKARLWKIQLKMQLSGGYSNPAKVAGIHSWILRGTARGTVRLQKRGSALIQPWVLNPITQTDPTQSKQCSLSSSLMTIGLFFL